MATKSPLAEVIAVGSELLGAARAETNSLLIAGKLEGLGIEIRRKLVVGDDAAVLEEAFGQALGRASLILITGGLGPTEDDITREVVASHLGRPLHVDPVSLQRLESIYGRLRLEIKPNSMRQVTVPEGSEVLQNDHGTAPGLLLQEGGTSIFLLPGPPRELEPMFENQVLPRIESFYGTHRLLSRNIRVASLAESAVDARVIPILQDFPGIEYTILSNPGLIELIFRSGEEPALATARLDALQDRICAEFGIDVYSTRCQEMPVVLGNLLQERGLMLAAAESCTGGAVSRSLTDIAGSSTFFAGGVVAYCNSLKQALLGVRAETLQQHGAVSSETALEMASGVCRVTGAGVGISITGVAGPTGGTPEKPVGTVWFGACLEGRTCSVHRRFPGDRASVRLRATHFVLDWLRRQLLK